MKRSAGVAPQQRTAMRDIQSRTCVVSRELGELRELRPAEVLADLAGRHARPLRQVCLGHLAQRQQRVQRRRQPPRQVLQAGNLASADDPTQAEVSDSRYFSRATPADGAWSCTGG